MKKIVLLAASFTFSLAMIAQPDAKTTKANVPAKVKAESKTPATEAPKVAETTPAQTTQVTPDELIKVNTNEYNFGKIKQGTPVTYYFELKNISSKPVVVENTYASCGCTTPDKILEPIAPGTTSKLKVQYNAGTVGTFTKEVHIKLAGITQEKVVKITGEVLAADAPKQ
jgi:hypothetical protein